MSTSGWSAPPAGRPGRRMLGRFLLAAVLLMFFAGAATATAVLLEVRGLGDAIVTPEIPTAQVQQAEAGEPQTILLVGSDRRFKDRRDKRNVRSDTIILVRMNPDAPATTVLSIPRDLKVRIGRNRAPDKINAAFAQGGAAATARVVKRTLSFPGRPFEINHIVNVNFSGFTRIVNRLGCVYTDVDRYYFNDNNPPAGGGEPYAVINIAPGYQKLCGRDALNFVRYRHLDTDIVRAARQQTFLSAMREQYGASRIFEQRDRLEKIFGRYTQTDASLHSTKGILKLLNLVIFSGRKPVEEVHFPARLGEADDPFVYTSRPKLRRAVERFMKPRPPAEGRRRKPAARKPAKRRPRGPVPGLVDASASGEQQGTALGAGVKLPVYYPRLITAQGRYMGPLGKVYPRRYSIKAKGRRYGAYRFTIDAGGTGQYYGVQGTSWKNPPILREPSEVRRVGGRRLLLFYDGGRLRVVGWKTRKGSYWITNTLSEEIGNRQMLGMAASLTRLGSRR